MIFKKIFNFYKNMKPIAKASLWFLFISFLQKGSMFLVTPFFTRILSTEEYGITTLYNTWLSILTPIITLNLASSAFNKSLLDHENDIDEYTSSILSLDLFSSIFFVILFVLFRKSLISLIKLPAPLIFYMFLNIILNQAFVLWTIKQRFKYKYILSSILTILSSLAGPIATLVILRLNLFSDAVFVKIIGCSLITLIIGLVFWIISFLKGKRFFSKAYWKEGLFLSLPLIPHVLSMDILNSVDKIMISNSLGNDNVAKYSVAYSITAIVSTIWAAIDSSFMPWTMQKFKEDKILDINKASIKILVIYFTLCFIPICIAPELLFLMGSEEYLEAIWCLSPTMLGVMLVGVYSLYVNIEYAVGNTKTIMFGSIFAALINVILNFIFIPIYGYIAAAYTTLISYAFLTLFHYFIMKFILKKDVYYNKSVFILSSMMIAISLAFQFTYNFYLIRYIIMTILLVLLIIFRKKIIGILKLS